MGAIYSRAEITIIAAAGEDPTYGLPGISRPFLEYADFFSGNLRKSKWASRAWTFQEGFLSQKALFFTEPNILLKCEKAAQVAETSNVTTTRFIRDFISKYEDEVDKELRGWRLHKNDRKIADMMRVLKEYVKRDLGFETDALNAIVGILNVFTIMNRSLNHLWGLPYAWEESNLTVALFWSNVSRNAHRRPGFPSWSPLGWTGKFIIFEPEQDQFTEGKDAEIRIMGDNNVPEILSGKPGLATFASQCLRVTAYSCRIFQPDLSLRMSGHGVYYRVYGHYVPVAVT
ncbi:hypothetical protein E8E13_002872 [Curvularia kusanoi]|uniref:Heterokaryon incompatibility domain-containing protein n=1 Tax=Curvularia kusanoi TaxID=90978 RepID=A0A9P4W8R7_CURKU|nr:hypothetical protein E8E13_002872 [Curvularia kusanoi]